MVCKSILFGLIIFAMAKISLAVQCNTNPCELGGDFSPPNYQCIQAADNLTNVICTCPDGQAIINARCRICDTMNCGPTGLCIEKSFFEGLYYTCGCTNGTYNYLNPGPCPDANPITSTTTISPNICLNGGTFNPTTSTCTCLSGFTGTHCQTSTSTTGCQNVVCANAGICNPISIIENGTELQCTCPAGFAGANCELVSVIGQCTLGLCQNGGVCEERVSGTTVYAYCRCPPGLTGQCCQTSYFSCPAPGLYADPINCKYGRYFQCAGTTLTSLSCPKGLRYNFLKMQCDYDVSCPP